jgi:hypothetical protein
VNGNRPGKTHGYCSHREGKDSVKVG